MSEAPATANPPPGYWIPVPMILAIAVSVILGRRRSFTRDGAVVMPAQPASARLTTNAARDKRRDDFGFVVMVQFLDW